ncbi:DNA polymerase I [Endomicrobium proavitum]|uniref:DNA polymerase I n=1 Tax=Endomicrobium proavitum TaxID=1408281 RepID=A0A0G3WKP8_9BACT|nr:DNA polymerase I [Endomicrobium proavitum]AKL98049.1 DNA polymerase I [Endomicrobium proavitum]
MKKFYIIDGNAYIHRAYHALPPLTTSNNQQVNAVYGFIKLLLKIKNTFKPGFIAVSFDYPAKNFRHNVYAQYKANRKPIDDALISQMPIAREAVEALNIAKIEVEGYEADDIIATLADKNKKEKIETVIVTGDKDILQLVEDDDVLVWNESKDIMFGEKEVEDKFGVKPESLLDVFALMGDVSDNIPGVKGIGEKTAVKLIKEFGTLENALENSDKVPGNSGKLLQAGKDAALMSKHLAALDKNVPLKYDLKDFACKDIDKEKAVPFFEKYEFNSFLKQLESDAAQEEPEQPQENAIKEIPNVSVKINLPEFKSVIIDTIDAAAEVAEKIKDNKIFSIKTVTVSEDSLKTQIVGVSFCDGQTSYYFPLAHNELTAKQLSFEEFKNIFKEVLTSENIKITGHDLKRERNIYIMSGIVLGSIYADVMLASYCLNPAASHDISDMSQEYCNFEAGNEAYLGKASKRISFADSHISDTAVYANSVSFASYFIWKKFEEEINNLNLSKLFFDVEMPLVEVLSEMEIAGIKVDTVFLKKFNEVIVAQMRSAENKIYLAAGKEFNINSPKQLADIMFVKLNLPVVKKTKTGYSTDESVLTELSSYEFPADVLKYRELQKIKSTYIDPISNYCVYYGDRIHTIFNQAVTTTGRLSSTEPNLQNIPIKSAYGREFRKAFIPEKNKIFISADYSQIDLRVLAHISGDEKLIKAFKDGQDIHSATAREVFNVPAGEPVADNLRSAAKAINFGIVYGMSPFGLSKQLNISFGEAKKYIDGYFDRYKGVKKWMRAVVQQGKSDGFVCTITGRVRFLPQLRSLDNTARMSGERMALNTPVQGSSADIIKIAMINIHNEIKRRQYNALMLLQVHDDLLFEVDETIKDEFSEFIKKHMENAVMLNVPLVVDVKTGGNWGEMKK